MEFQPEIISRAAARARGLNWFFTGKPCLRGHIGRRWVASPNCQECKVADSKSERFLSRQKTYRERPENKRRKKELLLRAKYGIGIDEYEARWAAQEGRCAICRVALKTGLGPQSAAVDHCHATGRVRGILCTPCNRALGLFRESREILNAAATYLGSQ